MLDDTHRLGETRDNHGNTPIGMLAQTFYGGGFVPRSRLSPRTFSLLLARRGPRQCTPGCSGPWRTTGQFDLQGFLPYYQASPLNHALQSVGPMRPFLNIDTGSERAVDACRRQLFHYDRNVSENP